MPLRLRRVRCRAAGGDGAEGKGKEEEEEAPESLFARELRRRGMAPGAAPAEAKEAEEGGGAEAGRKRGVAAAAFERGAAADGQRERSMALNSEGLEVRSQSPLAHCHTHTHALSCDWRSIKLRSLASSELEDQTFEAQKDWIRG